MITMDQEEQPSKVEIIQTESARAKQKEDNLKDEEKTLMKESRENPDGQEEEHVLICYFTMWNAVQRLYLERWRTLRKQPNP